MSDVRVVVTREGVETETVLDLLHSSLDWGSGFLDAEEIAAWKRFADAMGIKE